VESLKAGKSGIRRLETIEVAHVPIKIGAEVRGFDPDAYIDHKESRRMGRASQFAVAAAQMAVDDAGLTPEYIEQNGERAGVVIGTSLGSHEMSEQSTLKYKTNGYRKPNPLSLINALICHRTTSAGSFGLALNTPSTAALPGHNQSVKEAMSSATDGRTLLSPVEKRSCRTTPSWLRCHDRLQ
jgi:3-oxoacyl-(acyl-carrier-protein) synthase